MKVGSSGNENGSRANGNVIIGQQMIIAAIKTDSSVRNPFAAHGNGIVGQGNESLYIMKRIAMIEIGLGTYKGLCGTFSVRAFTEMDI